MYSITLLPGISLYDNGKGGTFNDIVDTIPGYKTISSAKPYKNPIKCLPVDLAVCNSSGSLLWKKGRVEEKEVAAPIFHNMLKQPEYMNILPDPEVLNACVPFYPDQL